MSKLPHSNDEPAPHHLVLVDRIDDLIYARVEEMLTESITKKEYRECVERAKDNLERAIRTLLIGR